MATLVGDEDSIRFMTGNINKPRQVERGRGREASLEPNTSHKAPPNGRGKPSGEEGKDGTKVRLRCPEERMVESTSLSIYFLPPNSVGVTENYGVGGQGSLKAKQVQDMTKNTGQ